MGFDEQLPLLNGEEPASPQGQLSPHAQVTNSIGSRNGRICDGVLEAVGQTPLIRLRKYLPHSRFHLYAKLEALNPGGSIKDRPALEILNAAIRAGDIGPGTVVVESSSGNMGIGLAQACRYHGIRFICVVDPKTTPANLAMLKAFGAEINFVQEPDLVSGEFLPARLQRVHELLDQIPGAFWTNQYANQENSGAHYRTTMREILDAFDGTVHFLLVPTSTCGTARGCGELVHDAGLDTRVIAVDAVGSNIFSDVKAKRLLPGLGASLRPPLCDLSVIHECVHVDDLDCIRGCRRLVSREAILAGGSSGGVLAAVEKIQDRIPPGANCVVILPDRGERYLTTVYSDEWVRKYCGDLALDSLLDP